MFKKTEHFYVSRGPAPLDERCHMKLCFTATDPNALRGILETLSKRDDHCYSKYDVEPIARHGMLRGRCFLLTEAAVVECWKRYKTHEDVLCTVQDDGFIDKVRDTAV